MNKLILASGSPWRLKMLQDAGLAVEAERSGIDERAVEQAVEGSGADPDDLAAVLAEAKALDVSERHTDRLVIGCDQVLSLEGTVLHKASDMAEARRRILALSGRTHRLSSAICLVEAGETVWRTVSVAQLTMRPLDPGFVGRYLAEAGEGVLGSVGAYQIEGPGIRLFERIEGDWWTIVGLPIMPLLAELRRRNVIDG